LNATGSGTINYSVLSPIPSSNTTGNFSGLPMGNYVFYITDSVGCSDTLSLTINGPSSIVNSSFTMDPVSGQPPLLVNFTNTSSNATNYYWEFGNGDTSSLVNPTNVFNDQGAYTVLLIATDGVCYDTSFQTLSVLLPSELVIYNVFSPNNDGTNDVWIFNYKNITNFNCLIYNRWGVLIFETNTIENGWEGKDMSGMDVSDGTYFYIIKAEGLDGKVYNLNGDLSLFRNR
jgi:gliding motility-associated-like protein